MTPRIPGAQRKKKATRIAEPEPERTTIEFNFRYIDFHSHHEFSFDGALFEEKMREKGKTGIDHSYVKSLLERIRDLDGWTVREFWGERGKNVIRAHIIKWRKVNKTMRGGFSNLPKSLRRGQGYQGLAV